MDLPEVLEDIHVAFFPHTHTNKNECHLVGTEDKYAQAWVTRAALRGMDSAAAIRLLRALDKLEQSQTNTGRLTFTGLLSGHVNAVCQAILQVLDMQSRCAVASVSSPPVCPGPPPAPATP